MQDLLVDQVLSLLRSIYQLPLESLQPFQLLYHSDLLGFIHVITVLVVQLKLAPGLHQSLLEGLARGRHLWVHVQVQLLQVYAILKFGQLRELALLGILVVEVID